MVSVQSKTLALIATLALAFSLAVPSFAFADETGGQLTTGTPDTGQITQPAVQASVSYKVHARAGKWQASAQDGVQAGKSSVVDALAISLKSNVAGSIQYQVYVTGKGWQKVRSNGASIGKLGKKYGIEAVRVALAGELSKLYNVTYSAALQGGKWQAWKRNGGTVGSAGSGKKVVALKVKLEKKASASAAGEGVIGVRYHARLKNKKWQLWQADNAVAGKTSKSAKIIGLAIAVDNGAYAGGIQYRVRNTSGKWKGWKKNGASTGVVSRINGVQIKLTGALAKKYDVVYRVNIKGVGWQKRVRNGATAGAKRKSVRIRAIRVQLVAKDKRSGWVKKSGNWRFYDKGTLLKSQWISTKEAPIGAMNGTSSGAKRYWLDSSGNLAVDRIIVPNSSRDKGAGFMAYAKSDGTLLVNRVKQVDGKWYIADSKGVLKKASMSEKAVLIERYVQWAIDIANDDSHGYSQYTRWGPDYDCSSLVVASLSNTGFEVGSASWTGNMRSELTQHGFRWRTNFSKLKRGDILLVHNYNRQHTEIYLGNGETVGAHIAETGTIYGKAGDQTGHEIDVGPYYSIWEGYLRFVG